MSPIQYQAQVNSRIFIIIIMANIQLTFPPLQFLNTDAHANVWRQNNQRTQDARARVFNYLTDPDSVRSMLLPQTLIRSNNQNHNQGFRLDLQGRSNQNVLYSIQQNGVGFGHDYGSLIFEFMYHGQPNNDANRRAQMVQFLAHQHQWQDGGIRTRINLLGTQIYAHIQQGQRVICRIRANIV